MRTIRNYKSADNAIGYTQASGLGGGSSVADPYTSRVVDSLFVGDTENIGNPTTPAEIAYGRSVPKTALPDFPIRGYEYYDNRHDVVNTKFVNFEDNATRKTGAISVLLFASFGVSSNNSIEKVSFDHAKPVYFPPTTERKWANDNGNGSAYRTAAIRDKDGSLGAGANSYVLIHDGVNDSIATDEQSCEIKPTWNAALCKGDVGRMNISAGGGGGGARGGGPGGGAGAGRGGPGAAPGGRGGAPGAGAAPRGPAPGGNNLVAQGPGGAPRGGAPGAGRGGAPGGAPGGAAGRGGAPGGAPGGAARGGAPGGAAGAAGGAAIVLSRNGKDYTTTNGTVRAGTEIKVKTETPSVSIRLTEMDKGSWVIFELPGFNTAPGTQ
jgi:hypothetical protein